MDFESLIFKAGEAKAPPPPPQGGIPRQHLPSPIRWTIRCLLLPFVLLDIAMQRVARLLIPPPYKQQGSCKQRGNCCYYILLRKPKKPLGALFSFWSTQIQGFYTRTGEDYEYEGHKVRIMGCRYLQPNGSCKHYHLRPLVCRKWPLIAHFGLPRILKGCGYTASVKKQKKNKLHILQERQDNEDTPPICNPKTQSKNPPL